MSNQLFYTPCKDKKETKCGNYPHRCNECTHNHEYVVMLAQPHKDYYEVKKK
jgi:hypothetical protein